MNEIHASFDSRNSFEERSVFLDISKTFDKVWHEGLVCKLKQNGVAGNAINFLINYLSGRRQRVVINGTSSEYIQVESGVPQGSVLGPLLEYIQVESGVPQGSVLGPLLEYIQVESGVPQGSVLGPLLEYIQVESGVPQGSVLGPLLEYIQVESGVPQGSVLGPLLFLIYINDLENVIKSKVKCFSADTMIYSIVETPASTLAVLNNDLELISQWEMSFNPEPSKQAVESKTSGFEVIIFQTLLSNLQNVYSSSFRLL